MAKFQWLHLLRRKNRRRAGVAVVVLPGLVPNSTLFDEITSQLAQAGDLWSLVYPDKYIDSGDLLAGVTAEIKRLGYRKIILIGISFGGTLGYLLMRYWKHRRMPFRVLGLVAVSSPFAPQDVSWQARLGLKFGYGLDKHLRRLFWALLRALRMAWLHDWRLRYRVYAKENSLRQMVNSMRNGYVLRQERLTKCRFNNFPALLINTRPGVADQFVARRNEFSFMNLFPDGQVAEGLSRHADLDSIDAHTRRQLRRFLASLIAEKR